VPKFDNHEEQVMRLMFGLADSIADASPSEVLSVPPAWDWMTCSMWV
jgi:hypothetical protein